MHWDELKKKKKKKKKVNKKKKKKKLWKWILIGIQIPQNGIDLTLSVASFFFKRKV
jgi:hypothetical protein